MVNENAELKRKIARMRVQLQGMRYDSTFTKRNELAVQNHFVFRSARVIHATTNLAKNDIAIDKGSASGVREGMGVINDKGVVGIVNNVSDHFSTVLPIINTKSRLNAKVDGKSEEGTLYWNGRDITIARLEEVPHYISVELGDTVCTSSYSYVFPEGIFIGTVVSKKSSKDNFYKLDVKLSADFGNLSYVDVIEFRNEKELKSLEGKEVEDE